MKFLCTNEENQTMNKDLAKIPIKYLWLFQEIKKSLAAVENKHESNLIS